MKREEEIKQAAFERDCENDFDSNNGRLGFEEGAQWADEHPISGEQIAAMKNEIKFLKRKLVECDKMYRELQNKNPWISVEERLPQEGMSVVARNDYGYKGYNHCVCVFKGGKFVVVVTNLTTGETQEIENNYVKAWMPIPKGGEE